MLDVKKLLAKILNSPFIVEEGTSGIWMYRKWSDGTAECWGYKMTSGSYSSWGSIYSHDVPTEAYPSGLFTSVPIVVGSCKNASHNSVGSINSNGGTKDTAPGFTVVRGTNASGNTNFLAFWHAIGRWK